MIPSLFSKFGLPGLQPGKPNLEEREVECVVPFTQGGGHGGLALGYYHAAPAGAPETGGHAAQLTNRCHRANNWVQATPVHAFLFVLAQVPGTPDPRRPAEV